MDPLEVAREYSVEKVLQKGARATTMLGAGTEDAGADTGAETRSDEAGRPECRVEPELPCGEEGPGKQDAPLRAGRDEKQPETPKNGNGRRGMDRDQKAAITKMAARYQIRAETLDRVLSGVKFHDEAAKIISELNRGDISRFLPAPA